MKRLQTFMLYMALTGTAFAQAPVIQNVHYGSWIKVTQAPVDTAQWMHFPYVASFDVSNGTSIVKKTIMSWATGPDKVMFPGSFGWAGSMNESVTFNSPAPAQTAGTTALDLGNCFKRNTDGVMVGLPLYFGNDGAHPFPGSPQFTFSYHTSTDNGATWTVQNGATITGFPTGYLVAGFHFHRGIIQDADGTLWAVAYAQFNPNDGSGYQSHRAILVKSTTGAASWTYVNTIQYTPGIAYTESTIARCKDGSILAIMRNDANSLKYRRSTDNGVNWTTVNYVPNIPSNIGVDPFLDLLPNGVLVLTYGDNVPTTGRNCRIAYDVNGTGASWTDYTSTFTGTSGLGNRSSGYTSVAPVRNNQFLQFSDRALYTYYGTNNHPLPNPFAIYTKKIELVLNYRNRIDLKTKYPGQVGITTNMTYTSATHPETGVAGAFDASTDYWSGAFNMSTSGNYTVDLLESQIINGLSICLLKGEPQNAQIDYSTDNVNWSPLKTYTNVTHQTVDYVGFSPVAARYIKVAVTAAGSATKVGINELNIFRTADTYEDYVYGIVPYGYTASDTASPDFWVTEGVTPLPSGYNSQRALYMFDNDGNNKSLRKNGYTASATKTFEFKLRTKGFSPSPNPGCVQFSLMSGTSAVFHMAVFPNGVIKYYNGTWNNVGSGPVSVPLDTWKSIKVVANASTNTASVYVDGTLIGSNVVKDVVSATTIDGFSFGSGGSPQIGDKALFDDVELYTTGAFPLALQQDAPAANETLMAPLKKDETPGTDVMTVVVSPNPADNVAKVTVKNIVKGPIELQLHDFYGRKLKSFSYMSQGDTFSIEIPVQAYGPGIYIITVKQNGKVVQTKLMK
ncbi:discoidin domain-containing protein [Mucilaginibacter boryungensis]